MTAWRDCDTCGASYSALDLHECSAEDLGERVDELLTELVQRDELVDRLAELLKEKEWSTYQGFGREGIECRTCDARIDFAASATSGYQIATCVVKHKSSCRLAAALRDAGLDVAAEDA